MKEGTRLTRFMGVSVIDTPLCPRCRSADTVALSVAGHFECHGCQRQFGPENPVDAGGTGYEALGRPEIDLRPEERAIRKALKRAAEKVRAAGVKNPEFFVEPEGPTIFVMDGDHPGQIHSDTSGANGRQQAIVARMGVERHHVGAKLDVGAW